MVLKETEEMVQASLCDTILAACRKTVPHNGQLLVEGLLRITADKKEIFLVNVRETLQKGKRRRRSYKPTPTKRKRRRPVIESEDDDGGEEDDFGEDTEVEEEEGVEEEDKVQVKEEPEEVVDKEAGQKESDDETAAGNVALELKNLAAQLADESVSDIAEPKTEETINETNTHDKEEEAREALPVKRKRGRPRKNPIADPDKPRDSPNLTNFADLVLQSGLSQDSVETPTEKASVAIQEGGINSRRQTRGKSGSVTCRICGKVCQSKAAYDLHKQLHTSQTYKCRECEEVFVKKKLRDTHERKHNAEMFPCQYCGKEFQRMGYLLYHEKKEHTREITVDRPYQCKLCQFKCKSEDRLKTHEDTQHGKPYQCTYCGKGFRSRAHLEEHEMIHREEKPFVCGYCDKKFVKQCNLREHERIHTGEKPFTCCFCGRSFSQKHAMKQHERSVHTGEKPYQCSICAKHFARSSCLLAHERTHSASKPFECDICQMRFTTNAYLKTHKRKVHVAKVQQPVEFDPEKYPYQCRYCEKRFTTDRSAKRHERIHTGENLHQCVFCGKLLYSLSDKKSHERIHTGEKIFACDVCGEMFLHMSTMKSHRQKQHNLQPLPEQSPEVQTLGVSDIEHQTLVMQPQTLHPAPPQHDHALQLDTNLMERAVGVSIYTS